MKIDAEKLLKSMDTDMKSFFDDGTIHLEGKSYIEVLCIAALLAGFVIDTSGMPREKTKEMFDSLLNVLYEMKPEDD